MILLPDPPKRHWVRAFWWAFTITATLVATAVAFAVPQLGGPVVGPIVGAVLLAAGAVAPGLRVSVYRAWNRAARKSGALVAAYTTRLLFFVVSVAGRGGSAFLMNAPSKGASSWSAKQTVQPAHYQSQFPGSGGNKGSWRGLLLSWSQRTGRIWMMPMVPLLGLLGMVQTSEKGSFGGNVYTLY